MTEPDTGADEGSAPAQRLDVELVRRGRARSRGHARDLITRGAVQVNGIPALKPAQPVTAGDDLDVTDAHRWVGRGAEKLDGALTAYGLDVRGRRALDVGASTGGFTQVLLERGAREVVALDVGHGQLVPQLRDDPRVRELSGTSVRGLTEPMIGGPVDLVVVDLSFISLTVVLDDIARVCAADADVILLVKPQFEVGRGRLGKKGVVTAPTDRAMAIRNVGRVAEAAGFALRTLVASGTLGSHGNREYLLWVAVSEVVGGSWQALDELIDRAVR